MSVNFWNFELSGTSAVDFWETGTSIDGTIPGLSRMTPEQLKKKLDIESGTGTSGSNIDYNEVNLMITSAVNNSVVSAMSGIPSTVSAAVSALPKNYKEYIDLRPDMYFDELVSAYMDGKGLKYTISDFDEPPETIYYNLQMKRLWGYNESQYAIFVVPENNTNMLPTEYMVLVPAYDSYDNDDDIQILAENNEQNESNNETRPLIKELAEFSEYPALNYNFPNDWKNQDDWYYTDNVLDVINDTEISNLFNFLKHCEDNNIDPYLTVNFGYINYYTRKPKLKVDLTDIHNSYDYKSIYGINGEDSEYYYHMNLAKSINSGLDLTAYALNKNLYFDFVNDIRDYRFNMRKISQFFKLVVNCYDNNVVSITNDSAFQYFIELIWDYPEKVMITGGTGTRRNYKFERIGYVDDDYWYPALIFSDTEDPELYHILQIFQDDTQDEGNQLYLEYITKTISSQQSNNSNGPLYENYIFDDEADPEKYVWNENGVITDIELIDYTYDEDTVSAYTIPCGVSALYIGHDGDLNNESGMARNYYRPANLSKILIHNNSTGHNPELNSGINVYYCGFSEDDIILSGVAEWGKSYVMDFVGPYVEWRDAPNMVKIPEPNFDNDDEGMK